MLFFPGWGAKASRSRASLYSPSVGKYSVGTHYVRSSGPATTGDGVAPVLKPAVCSTLPTARRSTNPADLNPRASPQSTCSFHLHRRHPRSSHNLPLPLSPNSVPASAWSSPATPPEAGVIRVSLKSPYSLVQSPTTCCHRAQDNQPAPRGLACSRSCLLSGFV